MVILSRFSKYIFKFILWLALFILALVLLFLYKPSYFLNNIESYFSNSLEGYFFDANVQIDDIEGNFFSGFNINNINISNASSSILDLKNISIKPSLKNIFYGKLVFNSIKIDKLMAQDLSKIKLNSKFNSKKTSFIPSITINKIAVENGKIHYKNKDISFTLALSALITGKDIEADFEKIDINVDHNKYYSSKGSILLSKENLLIDNFKFQDEYGLEANIYIDLNLFPLAVDDIDISLTKANLTIDKNISISDIYLSLNEKNSNYEYISRLYTTFNNQKEYIDINFNYMNDTFSFNLENQNIANNIFSIDGFYDLLSSNGELNIISDFNNLLALNGKIGFLINTISNIDLNLSLESCYYNDYNFNKILGQLTYNDKLLISSNLIFKDINQSEWIINDLNLRSFDDFSFSGTLKSPNYTSKYLLDWDILNTKDFYFKNLFLSYKYNRSKGLSDFHINGVSDKMKIGDLITFNSSYSISYYNKLNQLLFTSEKGQLQDHLFDLIDLSYVNNQLVLISNNDKSGEFLDIQLDFIDSNIFLNKFSGKINNTRIDIKKVLIDRTDDYYIASNVDILLDKGIIVGDFKYKNIYDYSMNLMLNDIDLYKIDKLMFLNNYYSGIASGDLYFSNIDSDPLFMTDLIIDNFKFDNFQYEEAKLSASFKNNVLSFNHFEAFSDSSSFNIAGFIELREESRDGQLSKNNNIELKGDVKNFNISLLDKYSPWAINMDGLMTSDISISGVLSNLRFEMFPTILNPKFDKVIGDKITGKISYKNNRLYFSDVIGKTKFGEYSIRGSLPVNFNYYFVKNIDEYPVYIDVEGTSTSAELIVPYFPFIKKLSGIFNYTLNIHGNYQNIIRDGEIVINDAELNILQLDNTIKNINAYALIDNNRLILNHFSASLFQEGDGMNLIDELATSMRDILGSKNISKNNINLSGSINLESFFNPDLSISIIGNNNYLSSSYGQFEGFASSNITITGQDTMLISGEFEPKFNQFTLFDVENRKLSNQDIGMITNNHFIAYDIFIPFPNGIKIKSDNINLFLEGEMNLASFSNNNVSISGKANIIDGSFFYNGNEFYNTQGTILIDPVIKSPYIELHSMTDIYEDNINVSFIGYTDNPNLILESTMPNYSQSDILQLLTFRDKNMNNSITEPFGNVIGSYLETQLEKNITLYTNLDEFRVQHSGSLMEGFNDSDINVLLGKRISNKLYLNTRINLNNNNLNEYEMSYRVSDKSSVVAKVDDNKYWQLNYRFKYKY